MIENLNYNPEPYEEVEQRSVVCLLEAYGLKFTSIPNSTYTKSRKQKQKNKDQGLRPGLPDLLIIIPNGRILFIEMKRERSGRVSPAQKAWIEELNKITNVIAYVCHGYEEAKKVIDKEREYARQNNSSN